uniref:Ymf60 n=1 Tax=Ichthyophthirius multifiliis TaxID=5932 RepID=G1FLC1_ICHMU|nr:Ymf60 [Ichthyophthirius multifiliis]AEL89263.1 Ymf60 [Ichthyophthirius multifiliis]
MFSKYIFLPYNFNILILNNKDDLQYFNLNYIYIYNNNFYFNIINYTNKFINLNTDLFFNKFTNTLLINNFEKNYFLKTLVAELNKFLFSLDNIFFKKIKFTGKGFKIKKKKNNISLFFNTAHINLFLSIKNITIRLNKSKYIIIKSNYNDLIMDSYLFKNVKPNNIFTKRGIRISRQIIIKKKGKN